MTTQPRVIGLYSPAPQSGKSTVARMIREISDRPVNIVPFAELLKDMVAGIFFALGYEYDRAAELRDHGKDYVLPELNCTVRHLYQTLGTEWGRERIHPDLWIKCWQNKALVHLDIGADVIADDMRFPNEMQAIRELGGECWMVRRGDHMGDSTGHASEGQLIAEDFDRFIWNNHSLDALAVVVRGMLEA